MTCVLVLSLCFLRDANAGVPGDIDNDGKTDVKEAVFALQVAAGLYPSLDSSCTLVGRGNWADAENYIRCDVVVYDGLMYACNGSHTSDGANKPPDENHWSGLTISGPQGPAGAVKVYDADSQLLGMLIGTGTYSNNQQAFEILIPSLGRAILVDMVSGDCHKNSTQYGLFYESQDCTGAGYTNAGFFHLILKSREACPGHPPFYVVEPNGIETTFYSSLECDGSCTSIPEAYPESFPDGMTRSYYRVTTIPSEDIPFSIPVALPIRYEVSGQ